MYFILSASVEPVYVCLVPLKEADAFFISNLIPSVRGESFIIRRHSVYSYEKEFLNH